MKVSLALVGFVFATNHLLTNVGFLTLEDHQQRLSSPQASG
jgi:hypothetical protein